MPDPERHGEAWSAEEERKLYDAYVAGISIGDCAAGHQRKTGGIIGHLKQMGLLDEEGNKIEPRPEFSPSPAAQKRALKAEKRKITAQNITPENLSPELNERFREALRLMEETNKNLFITGKAGTGKSTLLSHFCRTTKKQPVVLAPTGVAALNVKGQTIHRFFNFYIDATPEKIRRQKAKPRNAKLFKKLKTIIIDEVSMVRADLLDCIDAFLRLHGPDPARVFGGVQMIFVGDLYQLPPVVSQQEREIFASHYETPYFFSAKALAECGLEFVELDKVYRQKDQEFVDLLNKIRNNSAGASDIAAINSRLAKPGAKPESGYHITLTTTNAIADTINDAHLAALKGKMHASTASVSGNFGKEYFPTAVDLRFKVGAQIMMLNNDAEKRWVNGSIGIIDAVKEDEEGEEYLAVTLQDNRARVEVYPYTWEVFKFGVEEGAIVSAPAGTFTQYPFRLAWAVTIHKSQGKTFERVVIDIGRGAFAAGQMYVALSRCTTFEGVSLATPIRAQDIRADDRIVSFLSGFENRAGGTVMSLMEKMTLLRQALDGKEELDIVYVKADDTETERRVAPLFVGTATYQGKPYEGMKGFCAAENEERMFRVDRILRIGRVGR